MLRTGTILAACVIAVVGCVWSVAPGELPHVADARVTLPVASYVSDDGAPQSFCWNSPTQLTLVEAQHGDTIDMAPYQTIHADDPVQFLADGFGTWHRSAWAHGVPCASVSIVLPLPRLAENRSERP